MLNSSIFNMTDDPSSFFSASGVEGDILFAGYLSLPLWLLNFYFAFLLWLHCFQIYFDNSSSRGVVKITPSQVG